MSSTVSSTAISLARRYAARQTYVQLSREDFEDWLDDIGFRGKWKIKDQTGGVYWLYLSDNVAIEINSTTGAREKVLDVGKASMQLRLVSRITGQVLNKKAQGQKHFARTMNWRKNWKAGVDRMKDAYVKSASFYDALASIKDRKAYQQENLALIESVPDWQNNNILNDFHARLQGQGPGKPGILTQKQKALLEKIVAESQVQSRSPVEAPVEKKPTPAWTPKVDQKLIDEVTKLLGLATEKGDEDAIDLVEWVLDALENGEELGSRERRELEEYLKEYRIGGRSPFVKEQNTVGGMPKRKFEILLDSLSDEARRERDTETLFAVREARAEYEQTGNLKADTLRMLKKLFQQYGLIGGTRTKETETPPRPEAPTKTPTPLPTPPPSPEPPKAPTPPEPTPPEVRPGPASTDLLEAMRELWKRAKLKDDSWTMTFTQDLADKLKQGFTLSARQYDVLTKKLRSYGLREPASAHEDETLSKLRKLWTLAKRSGNEALAATVRDFGEHYKAEGAWTPAQQKTVDEWFKRYRL